MELFIRMIEYADLADVFLINQFQMRSNNLQTKHNNNSSMYIFGYILRIDTGIESKVPFGRGIDQSIIL